MELREDSPELERVKLNHETARIPWTELQRYFAKGHVVWCGQELDLIEVAQWLAHDDAGQVAVAMDQGRIAHTTDEQARRWLEGQAELWAVVVKPWVLVQEDACTSGSTQTPVLE